MAGSQRIVVVSTTAGDDDLRRIRRSTGRHPLVVTAPSAEAKRVVQALEAEPRVEMLLAHVRFPDTDRGHRLDTTVRQHALDDRFRDVVVVADPATCTLLLRVLAPEQLAERSAVTVVGLPRAPRRISARRALVVGVVLGFVTLTLEQVLPVTVLPAVVALAGLVLLAPPTLRHLGRELVLAAATGFGVAIVVIASSQRFPG